MRGSCRFRIRLHRGSPSLRRELAVVDDAAKTGASSPVPRLVPRVGEELADLLGDLQALLEQPLEDARPQTGGERRALDRASVLVRAQDLQPEDLLERD